MQDVVFGPQLVSSCTQTRINDHNNGIKQKEHNKSSLNSQHRDSETPPHLKLAPPPSQAGLPQLLSPPHFSPAIFTAPPGVYIAPLHPDSTAPTSRNEHACTRHGKSGAFPLIL